MFKSVYSRFVHESWNIAIREGNTGQILHDKINDFHVIRNPIFGWAADPFVYVKNNTCYIFAELLDYKLGRGTIAYTIYNSKEKTICKWKKIIVEDYHLSFPFIYEEDGNIFIIPESYQSNCLLRYKAVDFPDHWEKEVLMKGFPLSDTAIFLDEEKKAYTLWHDIGDDRKARILTFKNGKAKFEGGVYSEDQRICRIGGAFFSYQGKNIRVAQNCKDSYGKELIFLQWNKEGDWYSEEELQTVSVGNIKLDKRMYLDGIHTYNSHGGFEVIDLKTKRINIINLYWRLMRKLKKTIRGNRR